MVAIPKKNADNLEPEFIRVCAVGVIVGRDSNTLSFLDPFQLGVSCTDIIRIHEF